MHVFWTTFFSVLAVCCAHLCILAPPQRGGPHPITGPADPWCKLEAGPCGGQAPDTKGRVAYRVGTNVTVAFQKNVNHFNSNMPGLYVVQFAMHPDAEFTELARVADTNDPALTVYEASVVVPGPSRHGLFQVIYYTNNDLIFYACADVVTER